MSYGITPTGLVRPTVQELLDERNAAQKAGISQSWDTSPESIQGQANAIGCRQLGVAWESLDTLAGANDPDKAEDFLLTALSKLTGTWRGSATKSTVVCTVNLDEDTVLLAGEHFVRVAGKPNVRFTPRENIVADAGTGNYEAVFEAETAGPVAVASNTLTVIASPDAVGWNSCTNPNPATLGTVKEDDASLRAKREQDLARAGNQTFAAIRSDLLALRHEDVQWIKSVKVFENVDNIEDSEGRPSKSFEVLVYDNADEAPDDADDQIAQVIWDNKPAGVQAWGETDTLDDPYETGNAIDADGATQVVPFSRTTEVPIYVTMTLTTAPGFPGTATVKDAVYLKGTAAYSGPGSDVIAQYVRSIPFTVAGVTDVPTFSIGTAPTPEDDDNVSIGLREVATFDVAKITIP